MRIPPFAIAAALVVFGGGAAAAGDRVCVEEAAGICLKYRDAAPQAPAMSEAEAALSTEQRRDVQRRLRALGHYRGGIDAAFGPGTRRAISAWQQSAGFGASGRLNRGQIDALFAAPAPGPARDETAPPAGNWDEARTRMLVGSRCELRTREGYFIEASLRAGGQLNAVTTEGDYTGTWAVDGDEICMRIIGRKECRPLSTTPKARDAFYSEMEGACIRFTRP